MPPQAPWSPTAHAFAQHQFSHVANFWKQGRPASFRLQALPGGRAELNITFQLPPAAEVIPPPSHMHPAPPQRSIPPLFPNGWVPKGSGNNESKKQVSPKKVSSRLRKSYQRSVLHRAALAAHSLPPPKNGSLRQAAQACVQRLQAASALPMSTQSAKKRTLPDSPSALSSSNLLPLAQRIRTDIQVGESEVESPEKETLRSSSLLENSLSLSEGSPYVRHPSCLNCGTEMTPHHQCDATDSESNWEDVENEQDLYPTLERDSEDWAEKFTKSIRRYHGIPPN